MLEVYGALRGNSTQFRFACVASAANTGLRLSSEMGFGLVDERLGAFQELLRGRLREGRPISVVANIAFIEGRAQRIVVLGREQPCLRRPFWMRASRSAVMQPGPLRGER